VIRRGDRRHRASHRGPGDRAGSVALVELEVNNTDAVIASVKLLAGVEHEMGRDGCHRARRSPGKRCRLRGLER